MKEKENPFKAQTIINCNPLYFIKRGDKTIMKRINIFFCYVIIDQ
jgi:hypothetical protein